MASVFDVRRPGVNIAMRTVTCQCGFNIDKPKANRFRTENRPMPATCCAAREIRTRPMRSIALRCLLGILFATAAHAGDSAAPKSSVVLGLSHVPLAVRDLHSAAEDFEKLGFALKPGRLHANGIRNT